MMNSRTGVKNDDKMGGLSLNNTHDELGNNKSLEKIKDREETMLALPSSLLKIAEISNRLYFTCTPFFQQPVAIQKMQETLCSMTRIASPIVATQQNLCQEIHSTSIQQMISDFVSIPRFYIDFDYSQMDIGVKSLIENDALRASLLTAQRIYESIDIIYDSPIIKWIQTFDSLPLFEILQRVSLPEIDQKKFVEFYLHEMYDAHWFPNSICSANMKLTFSVIDIIVKTRKSKNRVKKIDGVIYGYYKKSVIEEIRKEWSRLGVTKYLIRILYQAVWAYHRREYAITVIVLCTLWEGIIYSKAHDNGRRNTKKSKEYFSAITEQNNYSEVLVSYYENFIMYNCNSSIDTIVDVPGRHSVAHSFYESYPTRKAALNAILFTDFLLRLKPLEEER